MGQSATKCAPPCLPSARFHIDHRKRLGKGTFGTAVLARDSFREKSVAAKIVKLTHSVSEKQLRREMVIQQHAACEHVAAVYGSASRWDQFVIFLELCSGGELCSLVATRGALPEAEVHGYFKQIIAGVVHMHSVGIVHRDLKLENVMLTDKGHVRIIDFGLAHQYSMGDDGTYKERPLSRCCGSEVYSAPEVLDPDVGYSYKADLWSCGVILFALLYGCFPLELASLSDWRFRKLIAAEKAGRGASFAVLRWIERPQHLSHKVCVLIDGLLRVQQAQRLSAVEASANEWVDMPSLSANLSYDSLCEISDEETRRNTARNAARDGPTAGGAPNTAHRGHVAGHVASVRRVGRAAGRRAVPCGVACRVAPRLLVRYLAQAVIREVGRERRHVDPLVGRGLHRREPLRLLHAQQAVNEHAHLVRQVLRSLDPAQDGEARAAPGLLGRDQLPEPPVAQAGKFEREAAIKQREENHPARPQVGLV
mmetsp:Transcript_29075/g.61070  ORF Transcript_29075/g.61070 Transcript_29075/m.61070 type:complete len:481 (+) Transcript_29075:367-1809(+)